MRKLPSNIASSAMALVADIETSGPARWNWDNYSKLSDGSYHCHLTYRYVACWRAIYTKSVEVYYVGTREKAPY